MRHSAAVFPFISFTQLFYSKVLLHFSFSFTLLNDIVSLCDHFLPIFRFYFAVCYLPTFITLIMSENHPFNETRILTELSGYNWKLTMMFKLDNVPVDQAERNIKLMASIVDLIPFEHPLTKKWTAKVEHYLEMLVQQSDSSDFANVLIQEDDSKSAHEVSTVSSCSSDNHLSIIADCRHSEAQPMNILLDVQSITLNYTNEKKEVTGQSFLVLSVNPFKLPRNVNRMMALPPRRSNSTEAIRQMILDTTVEESPTTIYSLIQKAFANLDRISGENQIGKIRNLVVLLVKCRIILRAFQKYQPNNKSLERAIFNWAFLKLNVDLAKEFNQRYYRPIFSSLISFFIQKLCTSISTRPGKKYNLSMVCNYCKFPGHYVKDCPETQVITCFNCFQLGHTRHLCNNKSVTIEELLDSL